MPHVLFDEYFYCAGEHGKKVPNSKTTTTKTTSEQRHDYLLKYIHCPGSCYFLSKSQFWLGSTHFQNHHEIIYFCLNNDYVAGNYFDFHLKKNTKLVSDLVI